MNALIYRLLACAALVLSLTACAGTQPPPTLGPGDFEPRYLRTAVALEREPTSSCELSGEWV